MKENNKNKINKILKATIIIQVIILFIALFSLFKKYNNYAFLGNSITDSQPYAKCSFAYKCECSKFSTKCDCIYYEYGKQPERIKCDNS